MFPKRLARAALLAALGLAALPMPGPSLGTQALRIATEGGYPPFNYTDTDGTLQGFEIEIGRVLCERMGVACVFVAEEWERLIPGLEHRRFDAVMASLEITDERRRRIAFSQPYYRTPAVFMARRGEAVPDLSPEALRTRRIGVMAGTPYERWLEQRVGGDAAVAYANHDEASLDLALGRIDLVLGDKIALHEWLKRGREAACCVFVGDAPRDPEIFGEGVGVGLRKEDEALRKRFDDALRAIISDGAYDRIRAAWFPFDVR